MNNTFVLFNCIGKFLPIYDIESLAKTNKTNLEYFLNLKSMNYFFKKYRVYNVDQLVIKKYNFYTSITKYVDSQTFYTPPLNKQSDIINRIIARGGDLNFVNQNPILFLTVSDYYKNYAIDVINKTIKSNVPHYILKSCDHIPWIFIEGSVKEIKIVFYNFEIKLFRSDEYTHISKYFPLYLNVMLTVFIDVYILIDYIDEINCKMCNINYMREYSQHIIHRTPFRTLHIMDYEENIHKYNFNAFAYLGQLENPPQQLIELLKPVECMSEKNKFLLYTS